MALLEVKDLRTYFYTRRGIVKSVDGVSFAVDKGETLCLVGESGSGKTVTCLSILRLVPPRAARIVGGQVIFDGEDLLLKTDGEMRKYRGRRLSMILQDPMVSLNPVFSVGNQVGEGMRIHEKLSGKALRDRVIELLRLVRIPSPEARIGNYPHELSGGMRQRVVGAIALACQPHLLICDEPTTSLDVTIQLQYLNLLKEIQRQRELAMIFITHDFSIVAKMSTKVAVMYAGRVVEAADVADIFDNPLHPYTRALRDSVSKPEARLTRLVSIEGQPPSLLNIEPGCAFRPRCRQSSERCEPSEFPPEVVFRNHVVRCWQYV